MRKSGRKANPLTEEQRALAVEYLETDISFAEIRERTGYSEGTVAYWVKKLKKERTDANEQD